MNLKTAKKKLKFIFWRNQTSSIKQFMCFVPGLFLLLIAQILSILYGSNNLIIFLSVLSFLLIIIFPLIDLWSLGATSYDFVDNYAKCQWFYHRSGEFVYFKPHHEIIDMIDEYIYNPITLRFYEKEDNPSYIIEMKEFRFATEKEIETYNLKAYEAKILLNNNT